MRKNDPIQHIMSEPKFAVQQGQPLSEVYKVMSDNNVHHIPILDSQKLVGLISFTDMMQLNLSLQGLNDETLAAVIDSQFTISDIMSTELTTLNDDASVRDAVEALCEGDFHSLPITNSQNEIVGIVTSTDLIRYLKDQY